MRRRAKAWLCATIVALAPGVAAGASLHGRASTVFQWWERPEDGQNVAPLTQYLSVVASDLAGGQDLAIRGYGQFGKDLASSDPWRGKVFYLYADWNDAVTDRLDLKAGRQFAQNAAGSAVVDGVDLDVHGFGPVGLRAFGGGDVQYVNDYRAGDWVGGLSLYLAGFDHTQVEVGVFATYDYYDNARTIVGVSASQDLWDWARAYGDFRYDLLGEAVSEILVGARVFPAAGWILTAEYYESLPVFDSTSIYSVFAVEKYQEGRFKASWDILPNMRVFGGVAYLWYDGGEAAVETSAGTRVFDVLHSRLDLEWIRRNGYGGETNGVRAVLGHDFIPDKLSAEAGVEYSGFQREEEPDWEATDGVWGFVEYRWTKSVATSARVEQTRDAGGGDHVEGILRVDWDF